MFYYFIQYFPIIYYIVPVVVTVGLLSSWAWPAIAREDRSRIHIHYKLLGTYIVLSFHIFSSHLIKAFCKTN